MFSEKLDIQFRLLLPKVIAILLLILSVLTVSLPSLGYVIPMFNVMVVYYWSVYRPSLMPSWFVFVLGVLQDALYGTPLGITAFMNLILRAVVVSQRRLFIKAPYIAVWIGFLVFSFLISVLSWLVFSLYHQAIMPFEETFIQWVLSGACYGVVHWILNMVYGILPDRQMHSHA